MRTLRLVAISDDGKSLILAADASDDGDRFELPIDDRLRAAARGDTRRLTQIDVDLGTELPPRVIQARIRSGETPEQVAAASGTRVERIMRFAHPVLQERARVAEQAQDARVRLSEGTPTSALARFMNERLRLLDCPVDDVSWDAHRGDEGTWLVTAAWRAGDNAGTTRWSFDLPSRTVTPHDAATLDFAEGTRLVRVVPDVPAGLAANPSHRSRPVTALRVGGRAAEPAVVIDADEDDETGDAVVAAVGTDLDGITPHVDPEAGVVAERPAGDPVDQALLDAVADHDTVVLGRTPDDSDSDDPRARIPAWEDIVFGVRRHR
ncbi:MAG TPA: septation protein SepH [Blastococcus sp.]|nr:septation protein SepH [Blastococcus sp.]